MSATRVTFAGETGQRVHAVDGFDVDIPRMVNALHFAAKRVGRPLAFGPCGVAVRLFDSSGVCNGSVLVSQAEHDGAEWIHASIAREKTMPTYSDLARLKHAVFGPDRYAYQVFPRAEDHVNIHGKALHLWGRADGTNVLPSFGQFGSI